MNNEEKVKKIVDSVFKSGLNTNRSFYDMAYNSALEIAQWKDEQVKQIQEREIKVCNDYIEKNPNNKLMLKYHLGRLSLCDELLGTDSKDKINMAFATMD